MPEPTINAVPVLQMNGISKSFPGVRALDNVSLTIYPGQVHALMGENGAGKSTLMKALAGAQRADSGEILLEGKKIDVTSPLQAMEMGINIIYQELNLVPHLTVAENIFLGREPRLLPGWVDRRTMYRKAQELMNALGADVSAHATISDLSIAEKQMVEIAKATSRQSKVIAMDEPSATLTEHELSHLWGLVRQLASQNVGIIYISHRMDEVFQIADTVTVLRDGKSVATSSLSDISRDQVLRWMVGRDVDETYPKQHAAIGAPVLEVDHLCRAGAIQDVSFTVHAGEIVGLAGLIGSGRTETARCIFGADRLTSGSMTLAGKPFAPHSPQQAIRAGVGFVTEDRKDQGLLLNLPIRENISLPSLSHFSKAGFISNAEERSVSDDSIKRLGVRTPSGEQKVGNLSGGNQQKVVLGKWLETKPKLLILDEPTRGIDVGAKQEIYHLMNALAAQGLGILMISSELPEVLGMADRVIVMRDGKVAGSLDREAATQEAVGRLALAG